MKSFSCRTFFPQYLRSCLVKELDFLHEAGNMERCARDLAHLPYVSVPGVHWSKTSKVGKYCQIHINIFYEKHLLSACFCVENIVVERKAIVIRHCTVAIFNCWPTAPFRGEVKLVQQHLELLLLECDGLHGLDCVAASMVYENVAIRTAEALLVAACCSAFSQ